MEDIERIALTYLPSHMQNVINLKIHNIIKPINEIRLRKDAPLSLTLDRKNVITDYVCSTDDLKITVSELCQGSVYSYAEYIKDGIIPLENGIRVGVCGRAVLRGGQIECVRDISGLNIRIPHRIYNASNALYEIVRYAGSVIIFSQPGLGKTTLLRELLPHLANKTNGSRVAVIDTRFELSAGINDLGLADIFLGYPRKEGISSAVRTMSPEYILCDEISDSDDTEAILLARTAGVNVVVSAHARAYSELCKNKNIKRLIDENIFGAAYQITESGHEVIYLAT